MCGFAGFSDFQADLTQKEKVLKKGECLYKDVFRQRS